MVKRRNCVCCRQMCRVLRDTLRGDNSPEMKSLEHVMQNRAFFLHALLTVGRLLEYGSRRSIWDIWDQDDKIEYTD